MTDVNSGKEWSAMDDADLDLCLHQRWSVPEIARFLCRDVPEVETRITQRAAARE